MKDHEEGCMPPQPGEDHVKENKKESLTNDSRRSFLSKVGVGGAAAIALSAVPLEPLIEGKHGEAEASAIPYDDNDRVYDSWRYRDGVADAERIDVGVLPDNGDLARYSDYSGSWSKCLPHDDLGIPNRSAYQSFLYALSTGRFQDWENVHVGNPGGTNFTATFNGPMGSYAFDLEGRDSHATNFIPPCPTNRSAQTADEEVEHYWGALCRDVKFTEYASNSLVAQACAEMNTLAYIKSNQNVEFPYPVTPQNLFRGRFYPGDGNLKGPYVSQFLLQPTFFGAQPLSQMYQRFKVIGHGGADYLTDVGEFKRVQNGFPPSFALAFDDYRFLRMGRDLAAYTHVDALHEAYFIAALVLLGINAPPNPGIPYNGSPTQHGFGTLGGPDALGTVGEMATRALKAAWVHKWIANLRIRPEEYGALLHARLTNRRPMPDAATELHPDILNSQAVQKVHSLYGTYLLPLGFPEGAPGHPCYPAGHGTVGGACIAALKFFFDGSQRIRPLLQAVGSDVMVPSSDGLSLVPYTGADRDQLTINGELAKLGCNITFGHGLVGPSIHFRSSSHFAMLLGEALGLTILQDRANSYAEPFSINIQKLDGTSATISNQD